MILLLLTDNRNWFQHQDIVKFSYGHTFKFCLKSLGTIGYLQVYLTHCQTELRADEQKPVAGWATQGVEGRAWASLGVNGRSFRGVR